MSDVTGTERPPLGIRVLHALGQEPAWLTMTAAQLARKLGGEEPVR